MVSSRKTLALFKIFVVALSSAQLSDLFRPVRQLLSPDVGSVKEEKLFRKSYDFIVVGAGSGGSVVANRLSENPKWSVLVLEAGKDEIFLTDVPLMAPLFTTTSYSWGDRSEKLTTACLGLFASRCHIPHGKSLGGTSAINFMLYSRGHRKDFDEWASVGNSGWSYEEILPYFIKSENCSSCQGIEEEFHGFEGYLNIENPGYRSPFLESFLEAGRLLGYQPGDYNGYSTLRFSVAQATLRKGVRCSASKAFLKSVQRRPNLAIHTQARVTKIVIDPSLKRAYGVEVLKNGKRYFVKASKEVILSAGSINSPHLLMLSGIGPKEDLQRAGIPVIKDLKVGYNLQDHMAFSLLAFLVNQSVTVSDLSVQNPVDMYNYIFNGKGPFTLPGGAEALAFIKTKYSALNADDYPDVELVLGDGAVNGDVFGSLRYLLGIPDSTFRQVYGTILNKPAFSIVPVLMRPRSKGRVKIRDANPLRRPILLPNYFEDPLDVKVLVEGIKMVSILFIYIEWLAENKQAEFRGALKQISYMKAIITQKIYNNKN